MALEKTEAKTLKEPLETRVAVLEAEVRALAPLGELLTHITQIKRVFGAGS